jgi:serine/threonine protein kinase
VGSASEGGARFRIEQKLGAGGFGEVFRAFDTQRGIHVALKTLQRADAASIYRFKREFRSLADVAHPNLVQLHELSCEEDKWFFTMELIEGIPFVDFVRGALTAGESAAETSSQEMAGPPDPLPDDRQRALDQKTTMRAEEMPAENHAQAASTATVLSPRFLTRLHSALAQLVEGVAALHVAGKLHRDLKPSNVLVTGDGRVVLLDFGLIKELHRGEVGYESMETTILGSPHYMAPEQAAGQPASEASDWYGVGVMLYEALTGRLPVMGGTLIEILAAKNKVPPPAPADLVPSVPEDLNTLCVDLPQRSSSVASATLRHFTRRSKRARPGRQWWP